jgi:hypothetical protein
VGNNLPAFVGFVTMLGFSGIANRWQSRRKRAGLAGIFADRELSTIPTQWRTSAGVRWRVAAHAGLLLAEAELFFPEAGNPLQGRFSLKEFSRE